MGLIPTVHQAAAGVDGTGVPVQQAKDEDDGIMKTVVPDKKDLATLHKVLKECVEEHVHDIKYASPAILYYAFNKTIMGRCITKGRFPSNKFSLYHLFAALAIEEQYKDKHEYYIGDLGPYKEYARNLHLKIHEAKRDYFGSSSYANANNKRPGPHTRGNTPKKQKVVAFAI